MLLLKEGVAPGKSKLRGQVHRCVIVPFVRGAKDMGQGLNSNPHFSNHAVPLENKSARRNIFPNLDKGVGQTTSERKDCKFGFPFHLLITSFTVL